MITGKGVLNNRISVPDDAARRDGIPTHFVRRLNMREQLVREVEMIPLEVVVRNFAAGSFAEMFRMSEERRCRARSSSTTTSPTS